MENKLDRIETKIDYRQKLEEFKSKELRKRTYISIFMFLFSLFTFAGGFMLADAIHPGPKMIVPEHNYSIDNHEVAFNIMDTQVIFQKPSHPDMNAKYGYRRNSGKLINDDAIYLRTDRENAYEYYTTCVHEWLHLQGVEGSDKNERFLARVESDMVSPLCIQTIYEFGKYQGSQGVQPKVNVSESE